MLGSRLRSFFQSAFRCTRDKGACILLLIELLSAAQNLINFHYNFVDFMEPARFPISAGVGGEINLMPWHFSWVALYTHTHTHTERHTQADCGKKHFYLLLA